jgi:hypothetical protein
MHVAIERLYAFVMGELDLREAEQSHLIRCDFCIEWLDASVTEKIAQVYDGEAEPFSTDYRRMSRRASRNRRRW